MISWYQGRSSQKASVLRSGSEADPWPVPKSSPEIQLLAPELPHSVHHLLLQNIVLNLMPKIYTAKRLGQKSVKSLLVMQTTKKKAQNSKRSSRKQEEQFFRFFFFFKLNNRVKTFWLKFYGVNRLLYISNLQFQRCRRVYFCRMVPVVCQQSGYLVIE